MYSPLISVIIPIYNSEKYLRKCLNSLIFQMYENLEIICINDSSTDYSLEIVKEFEKKDNRIKILNNDRKIAQGAGFCRNMGLIEAKGEYISFLDSDDWVYLTLYKNFVDTLNKINSSVDIYMFNYSTCCEKKGDIVRKNFFLEKDFKNHDSNLTIHTFKDYKKFLSSNLSACNKIFSKNFLDKFNIKFPNNLIYEDFYFTVKSFLNAQKIIFDKKVQGRYRTVEQGSTMTTKSLKVFDIFEIMDLIEIEIRTQGHFELLKYALFQLKYTTYFQRFTICPIEAQEKFYNELKQRLIVSYHNNLDYNILKYLKNYEIFEKIKNSDFEDFREFVVKSN